MKDINIGQTVQYSSYHIAKELFFGLLIDESIDITTYKNLIVYAHIWNKGEVSTHFISNNYRGGYVL